MTTNDDRCEAPGCDALLLPGYFQGNTVIAIDISADDSEGLLDSIKICDACRRILCTCGQCSAYFGGHDGGQCHREPPRIFPPNSGSLADWSIESPYVMADQCFRDCWQQARPWTLEETRRWLGLDADAEGMDGAGYEQRWKGVLPERDSDADADGLSPWDAVRVGGEGPPGFDRAMADDRPGLHVPQPLTKGETIGFASRPDVDDGDGSRFTTDQANAHIASGGHWGIPSASHADADDEDE